ncbi:MAG: ribosomal RNA small subunit methyltransferase A [Anaerolineae bacterium]|jgi:16S rRNA (adenine1518-N6/adenine1519-N6)-dimethyltransferase|nr:ribosomal RNA small subunit methyltransferase A [Anaerolineae bacterium]MBT3713053.1 ribosomal RNA small subunit methyltransferase A [Anaerolineae bacterium]MBT4311521.1 ribosomal RNA small subunit methyltransferase A [Anaerolineae bacterium]MBT4456771.1 ribosomal RNA small subunit methyltransferase A [Anaerolineae bacterium]MBT6062784.1 ribosomal RNA small subunit methyltransferase A [Anaerolineae bacterium]
MPTSTPPPLNTAAILQKYGLRPKKKLGQNFLQDPNILNKIVQIAEVSETDTVLEIGPGLGSLTRHLAASAKEVVAVEIDSWIIPALKASLDGYANSKVIEGDMLEIAPSEIISAPEYLVVANIPYYITSALLRHLLENNPRPNRMILTIQKEVAKRICVPEGKKMSLLALSVQVYGKPEIAGHIPAGAFYPPPKVDSAIICIKLYPKPRIPASLLDDFFLLAKAGFSQKRKTLRNALAGGLRLFTVKTESLLRAAEIDPRRRAETLNLDEWGRLSKEWVETKKS